LLKLLQWSWRQRIWNESRESVLLEREIIRFVPVAWGVQGVMVWGWDWTAMRLESGDSNSPAHWANEMRIQWEVQHGWIFVEYLAHSHCLWLVDRFVNTILGAIEIPESGNFSMWWMLILRHIPVHCGERYLPCTLGPSLLENLPISVTRCKL